MPYVRVELVAGRSPEVKQAIGKAITEAIVQHAGGQPRDVFVVFQDVPADDWMIEGESVALRRRRAASPKA
jgi:4-oxalocrotonate tautomerase